MRYILLIITTISFSLQLKANEPLRQVKDTTEESFRSIVNGIWDKPKENSPLWDKVDFSQAYYDYVIWETSQRHGTDVTRDLRGFELDIVDLFSSFNGGHENATPQNGIFGPRNKRLQVYISNYSKAINNQDVEVYGSSRRGKQVYPFKGTIHIEHILESRNEQAKKPGDTISHTLIATFIFNEDSTIEGSGQLKGTYCANVKAQIKYDFLHNTIKREIWTDDENDGHYGYSNRNFVGVWTSHTTGEQLKAIWGDNALPFPLDFKIGYSEQLNERYIDDEWAAYLDSDSETEAVYNEEGDQTGYKQKNEWWNR